MPRYDHFEKMHKKRKGGGWNPTGSRRPPMNPQGNYSDILPRVSKDSQSSILGGRGAAAAANGHHSHSHGQSHSHSHGHAHGHSHHHHSHHDSDDTLRSNIHVVVRIRPKNFNEKGPAHRTIVRALGERVVIFDPKEDPEEEFYFHGIKQKTRHDYTKKPNKNLKFAYDRVYGPHNTNNEIFETSVKKLVSHIIDGFNCSIFAYGATGAGKTYTMLGSFEHPGLTFLMAMELYNRINGMANEYESEIVVSYLEVYNETLRDLLHPSGILSIREDGFNGVNIPNLTMHKPKDASELLGMLSYGNSVRTQHPTDHNAESSRSHAVFQVFVSLRKRFTHKSLKYKMAKAKLVMVDLAGSERGLSQGCDNQRFREGANINKSLLALSNCINALADGHKHVPYRDSKLTRILKDSLGGNCKTVMIANVSPSQVSYDDTYNTLKYAGRAKEIRINCKKNFCTTDPGIMTYTKMVDDLQLEIQQLKTELQSEREARKKCGDHLNNNGNGNSNSYKNKNTNHTSIKIVDPPPLLISGEDKPMNLNNYHINCSYIDDSPSQLSSSPLITPTQNIPDPVALENFIQLLSQKKKLEEDHAESSIASKELEWTVQWKKWKIEAAKFAMMEKSNSNANKLNSSFLTRIQQMKSYYENLLTRHKELVDKVHLAKQVLDFNEREIDLAGSNCLDKLSMEDPFLTVTLREFLYYKSLEREVSAHKSLENYHQKMCLTIFEELLNSETILGNSLKFQNYIYDCLQDRDGVTEYIEAKRNDILNPIFGGEISLKVSTTDMDNPCNSEFPPTQLLQELWELMRNPVVEYESSPPERELLTDENENGDRHRQDGHGHRRHGHGQGPCHLTAMALTRNWDREDGDCRMSHDRRHRHLCTPIRIECEDEEDDRQDLEEVSSGEIQESSASALQSISTDTVNEALDHERHLSPSPNQTASLENSSIVTEDGCSCAANVGVGVEMAGSTSSSNDVLTLHRPKKYVSVESLFDRGVTARTVPFSAAPSDDSAVSDDRNDADDATDFEEAIKYSNSDLLEYMDTDLTKLKIPQQKQQKIESSAPSSKRHPQLSNKVKALHNNHTTNNTNQTRKSTNHHHHTNTNHNSKASTSTKIIGPPSQIPEENHHHQNPWLQNTMIMANHNNNNNCVNQHPIHHPVNEDSIKNTFYNPPRTLLLGEMGIDTNNNNNISNNNNKQQQQHHQSLIYDNAEVQVSEVDLLTLANNESRPLTFCYPNNYNNNTNRNLPLYQGHQINGDR